MKTKNKMIALLEIVVVLCSVFLVATLPAIAADQNQRMQTASAVTTASEDDYVLGIYGNGNEDDTIDMGDVVYTKLAIFGKKQKTKLCDAKYDGRINVLDVIQTKLIILGKEKEITFVVPFDPLQTEPQEAITIHKPVERIVVLTWDTAEVLRALDAKDKIVGVTTHMYKEKVFFPDLSKLPCVGSSWSPKRLDYEAILDLNTDVVMAFTHSSAASIKEKLPSVAVIYLGLRYPENYQEKVNILGYILDKEEEAEEFANWYESWINKIKSRTSELSEDEKPRVFIWSSHKLGGSYKTVTERNRQHQMCVIAGGKNIAEGEGLTGAWPAVDPEWVMDRNPEFIIALSSAAGGYGVDDTSEMAVAREDILNRHELAKVVAVTKGDVYITRPFSSAGGLTTGPRCLVGTAYWAKWFHPKLFEDLDPKAIHQEYITRFQGLDYDLDEHGVFVYHPEEHPDGH